MDLFFIVIIYDFVKKEKLRKILNIFKILNLNIILYIVFCLKEINVVWNGYGYGYL